MQQPDERCCATLLQIQLILTVSSTTLSFPLGQSACDYNLPGEAERVRPGGNLCKALMNNNPAGSFSEKLNIEHAIWPMCI